MAKLKVMKTMMLVAAVAGILACFGGGSGVRAHAGDGEMLRLLKAVDLDENLVISEEEVAAWAAANGAVHVGPEQHSAPLSFAHEHVSALAHLLSSPILDGESYALQRATARRPLVGAIGSYSITPYPLTHTLAHTNTHTLAHTLAHTLTHMTNSDLQPPGNHFQVCSQQMFMCDARLLCTVVVIVVGV